MQTNQSQTGQWQSKYRNEAKLEPDTCVLVALRPSLSPKKPQTTALFSEYIHNLWLPAQPQGLVMCWVSYQWQTGSCTQVLSSLDPRLSPVSQGESLGLRLSAVQHESWFSKYRNWTVNDSLVHSPVMWKKVNRRYNWQFDHSIQCWYLQGV